jgi:hypothetical protein
MILREGIKGQKKRQPQVILRLALGEMGLEARRLASEDAEDFADQSLILALFLQVFDFYVVE